MGINNKPLGRSNYGSIGHLPGSRLGPADHKITDGQEKICLDTPRDKHDIIIITEKVDGSNCGVVKIDGQILALSRSGYLANTSKFQQHKFFDDWVMKNVDRFNDLLQEGERLVGEWMAMAHGTKYDLPHEPFIVFDLMIGNNRETYWKFLTRIRRYGFIPAKLISYGLPMDHKTIRKRMEKSGHGAIDPTEGYVCRVERLGKVDFLAKWVRPDKIDGKYFKEKYGEDVWNWKPQG